MNSDIVKKIAKLSKLNLSDEEIELYSVQFANILKYMDELSEVDVEDIEPYMTPVTGNLREDIVNLEREIDKDIALSLSSNHDDNYFLVPKVK